MSNILEIIDKSVSNPAYKAALRIEFEQLQHENANMRSRIKELKGDLNIMRLQRDAARARIKELKSCMTTPRAEDLDRIDELQQEVKILQQGVTQRGARMQVIRDGMRYVDWMNFTLRTPEADDWFDADGVPVPIDYGTK